MNIILKDFSYVVIFTFSFTILYRHLAVTRAVQTFARLENDKDSHTSTKVLKKTTTTKLKKNGGSEVYDMFTAYNHCILDERMIQEITKLAQQPSGTDYNQFSKGGTTGYKEVLQEVQKYMDAYYKCKKSDFTRKIYPDAYEFMEVYIKTMYLVKRGLLLQSDDYDENADSPNLKACILWSDSIGKFQLLFMFMYIAIHIIYTKVNDMSMHANLIQEVV